MYNDILKDLLNYAFDHGIGIETVHANMNTPCLVLNNKKLIVLNLNWNKSQIPFALSHEIAHIINEDDIQLYRSNSCNYKLSFEYNANFRALNILIPIYLKKCEYTMDNISPLMDQLKIPNSLINETKQITSKYIQKDC
ncbi:ImmA/IrrE family metallo-endopeptidase [Apilactobacillus micheneri]|uniref:ImmA/IrrE family metallo-endopeptidase n=1 Tax=Apilactobacillus micheneri TaxID=1899430 RepID=UPI000D03EA49|nr:ImmA/IrrE family metallo-endopeptidase [Apilactobacillus micheneri]